MIALMKEPRMDQQFRNRQRFSIDLCGPYAADECESRDVRCDLQIERTHLVVDIPAEVLRRHRLAGSSGDIVLRIPGEPTVPVNAAPPLTEKQRKSAAAWSAEMHDFDRF